MFDPSTCKPLLLARLTEYHLDHSASAAALVHAQSSRCSNTFMLRCCSQRDTRARALPSGFRPARSLPQGHQLFPHRLCITPPAPTSFSRRSSPLLIKPIYFSARNARSDPGRSLTLHGDMLILRLPTVIDRRSSTTRLTTLTLRQRIPLRRLPASWTNRSPPLRDARLTQSPPLRDVRLPLPRVLQRRLMPCLLMSTRQCLLASTMISVLYMSCVLLKKDKLSKYSSPSRPPTIVIRSSHRLRSYPLIRHHR